MTDITPGFKAMSNIAYHQADGLSSGTLRRFWNYSPLHSTVPIEDTAAMVFGGYFHEAIEDPEAFEKKYIVLPDSCRPGSGTGMKSRKEEFEAQAETEGKIILQTYRSGAYSAASQKDLDTLRAMSAAVHSHQGCIELMTGECMKELTGYWVDPTTGLLCKLRADLLNRTKTLLIDWKSCTDARQGPWCKKAWDLGYHIQGAWYLWGVRSITGEDYREFRFVAIEKEKPYGIQIHPLLEDARVYAEGEIREALDQYSECVKADDWPCYDTVSAGFGLPNWKKREIEFNGGMI